MVSLISDYLKNGFQAHVKSLLKANYARLLATHAALLPPWKARVSACGGMNGPLDTIWLEAYVELVQAAIADQPLSQQALEGLAQKSWQQIMHKAEGQKAQKLDFLKRECDAVLENGESQDSLFNYFLVDHFGQEE
jgi:hypothetical protein